MDLLPANLAADDDTVKTKKKKIQVSVLITDVDGSTRTYNAPAFYPPDSLPDAKAIAAAFQEITDGKQPRAHHD